MSAYEPSGRDVVHECRLIFTDLRLGLIDMPEFKRRLDAVEFCVAEGRSVQPKLFEVTYAQAR